MVPVRPAQEGPPSTPFRLSFPSGPDFPWRSGPVARSRFPGVVQSATRRMTSAGSSVGSSHTRLSPVGQAGDAAFSQNRGVAQPEQVPPAHAAIGQPDDPTVISQRPPQGAVVARSATAQELGRGLIGQTLDHFELTEYVGGGGMGAVFRARDTLLKRDVAVKVLSPEQAADEETLRRFQNEAQSAARLDHENIARVFYVGQSKGLHYIVFEFIEGENLRDLVERRGALPIPEALSYTLQIAEALAHAASRDVVHRDIKPSNVIITADGRAKLVDMGLARLHQPAGTGDLTASGVTLGTFDYISPEQARDPRAADVRSDIYSLGCTLYFMLCQRPPFPQGTVLQKLLQHTTDVPPDPREINPQVPPEFAAVVRRMLAKEPRWRYQHPHDLIRDLLALAERWGLERVYTRVQVAPAPAPRLRLAQQLPWLAPVAALLCLVAALHALDARHAEELAGASRTWSDLLPPAPTTVEPGSSPSRRTPSEQASPGAPANNTAPASNSNPSDSVDAQPSLPQAGDEPADARLVANAGDAQQSAGGGLSRPAAGTREGTKSTPPDPMAETSAAAAAANGQREPGNSGRTPTDSAPQPDEAAQATPQDAPGNSSSTNAGPGGSNQREPAPLPPGMLVVWDGPAAAPYYSSLQAAVAAAKSGEIVELRYTGVRDEQPLALNNIRLTLRAGEGYRPVVRFRPQEADPLKAPRAMLSLSGGRLSLVGLSLELDVPSPRELPVDDWALFEAAGAELLELERCWLTVRNATASGTAFHPNVAFVGIRAGLQRDGMMMPDDMAAEPTLTLRLRNCVARGEAVLLRVSDGQPVDLTWDNGLFASSERLLAVSGAAATPRAAGRIHLDLRHLTAAVGRGLARIAATADAPYLPPCEIDCSNSLLVAWQEATLIEHQGLEPAQRIQQQFNWSGERNVYDGFTVFWQIQDGSAMGPVLRSFREWRSLWGPTREAKSQLGPVPWQRPLPVQRPTHTHVPADYTPDPSADDNPARQAASDGRDCGLDLQALPPPARADT